MLAKYRRERAKGGERKKKRGYVYRKGTPNHHLHNNLLK